MTRLECLPATNMLKSGCGVSPQELSKVEVHFVGKGVGGQEFHSTHASGHAVSFLLGTGQVMDECVLCVCIHTCLCNALQQ